MKRFILLLCLACPVSWANLAIEQWQTNNGTNVLFVHAPEVPMLDISLAFKAGSAYDGKLYGLSALTADLLDQGSKGKNVNEIADKLADSGAQFSSNTTHDMAIINLRTLTETKPMSEALTVFEWIINHPEFPAKAFEREKHQQLTAIKQAEESPNTVANRRFFAALYGEHPYAHPILGRVKTVNEIKPSDVVDFYNRYFVGSNATMAIVGAISKKQAIAISEQLTLARPQGLKAPDIKPAKELASAETKTLQYPSSQTVVRIGQLGITHHNPDYFPLMVGNYTLGGGSLVSRLAIEIREKRGLSYNVGSAFLPMPAKGPFIINLATKNQQAPQAIEVTLNTLKQFIDKGPSDAELNAAKNYLTGSFPLSLASNRSIAGMLIKIGFYRLPIDYLSTYLKHIDEVTTQQIKQAFANQIHPDKLLMVTVGRTVKSSPESGA